MTTGQGAPVDRGAQLARLRRFLVFLMPSIFFFAGLEGIGFVAFGHSGDAAAALLLLGCGVALLLAFLGLQRGQLLAPLTIVSSALLVLATTVVLILPYAAEPAILGPLVVVALVLPYFSGRRLRVLIVVCWIISIAIALLPEVLPATETAPAWFVAIARTSAVAVAVALVFVLLWQFSSRLREAVAELSTANDSLREMQTTVTRVNAELRRRVRELEERNQEISVLSEMGELLQVSHTLTEAYSVIARSARNIFPAQSGALYLLDEDGEMLHVMAEWGDSPPLKRTIGRHECWGLRRGRFHLVEDAQNQPLCPHIIEPWPATHLCLPLIAQSETLGLLHLRTRPAEALTDGSGTGGAVGTGSGAGVIPPMGEERLQLSLTVAEHIAMALANFRLRESLRIQSIRDPLTGLYNRRYMEESLDREARRADREHHSVGIILIDLDHLKRFNDDFGHEAGDMVLRALGRMLQGQIRVEDIACRYGGEEFVLILPKATVEDARKRAERVRVAAARLRSHNPGLPPQPVTLSLGVAAFPDHGSAPAEVLRVADAALYRAKAGGRDQVVVAPVGQPVD